MKIEELYKAAQVEEAISDPEVAHLIINKDEVAGENEIPGVKVSPEPIEDGVYVKMVISDGAVIEKPVHMCFGVTGSEGLQNIKMDIEVGENAEIGVLAHCIFPEALDVRHVMDANISVGENAKYSYLEKHIHSKEGGILVDSNAEVVLEKGANFRTDFELIEGRVGELNVDYSTVAREESTLEMTAKVDGREDDKINIEEKAKLIGRGARGVLTTRVAARGNTEARVYNELLANAPESRGHVDCKEIIQDEGSAKAVPIVEVNHPKAHVTHEAAIGSVDDKQLQTLLARGLSEEQAVDLIIKGLLS